MGLFKCILYLTLIGITSFLAGRILPPSWCHENHFPYKSYSWEHAGAVYNTIKIRKWQNKVPDMSRIFPGWMQAKKIGRNFRSELPLMIKETCIAEFIHFLLCLAAFHCVHLWPGIGGFTVSVIYVLANIPFILIQRYNRPRLIALQEKTSARCI